MENFEYKLDQRTPVEYGAKFLMFQISTTIEIVLIPYRSEHAFTAHEILKERGGEENKPLFIGAGVVLSERQEVLYDSPSCRDGEEGFGRDCPDDPVEANTHLIQLRSLLGWNSAI